MGNLNKCQRIYSSQKIKKRVGSPFQALSFRRNKSLQRKKAVPKDCFFSSFFPLILFGIGLQCLLFLLPVLLYSYKSPKLLLPTSPLLSLCFFSQSFLYFMEGWDFWLPTPKKLAIFELFRKGTIVIFLLSLLSSLPLFLHPLYCSRTSALLSKADVQGRIFCIPIAKIFRTVPGRLQKKPLIFSRRPPYMK